MPGSDLESRLLPALRTCAGQHLCVAFSGGLDSTVLLYLLARLATEAGFVLSAIHVHHGLSPHADAWVAHCEQVCAGLGVPLCAERVTVARDAGKGLEAAARAARHAVFAAQAADWIVLAHHADDQAETLVHRLLRGSGVAGAAAMREHDAARRLWRPLLGVARADLLGWAQAQGLRWIEDESNRDEALTRNFLRHRILTPLKARQPAAVENLCRATGHFAEAAGLLAEMAAADVQALRLGEPGARRRLLTLSAARQRNLLRYWLGEAGVQAPTATRLDELLAGLATEATALRWVHDGLAVCAWRADLWQEPAELSPPQEQVWRGEAELPWGEGRLIFTEAAGRGALRLAPQAGGLQIKPRSGGERMRLAEGRPTRLFKQLCQEAGIPPWWREGLPLLWRGNDLLWIGGIGPAAGVRAEAGEPGWRIEWIGPDGLRR